MIIVSPFIGEFFYSFESFVRQKKIKVQIGNLSNKLKNPYSGALF